VAAAQAFVDGRTTEKVDDLALEDVDAEDAIDADDEAAAEAAAVVGAVEATAADLRKELAAVDDMMALAEKAALRPDARVHWVVQWIKDNMLSGATWNNRRLIIFTEWEDTRRWLEKRLREAFADSDRIDERIGIFTGATGQDRREEVKAAFNADPAKEPLRILICTDAAREGINLQTWCSDLIHFDLPWNPSRLEQRNGRIDRKLQPAKQVFCRYFKYEQREADIVLEALVRKSEVIQRQLGSAGQVIEQRIKDRLEAVGIDRGRAETLARAIEDETDAERLARARAEMDDDERARYERIQKDQQELQKALEDSRERVGVAADDLRRVVGAALIRAGTSLDRAQAGTVGNVTTFTFDPADPAFARETGWQDTFDDLRARPRKRGERINDWRKRVPIRAIAFETPRLPDGRDSPEVVQVHLEHRLVRRLLSRFLSQGFQSGLSRIR
jgi:superfamily II DNA/RNA helicase